MTDRADAAALQAELGTLRAAVVELAAATRGISSPASFSRRYPACANLLDAAPPPPSPAAPPRRRHVNVGAVFNTDLDRRLAQGD